ncbi:MAG TPA: hypothetical protein VKU84_14875 [Stellaceae bacterium]|nr:hypothetical protein [Stellaceae bacterium]
MNGSIVRLTPDPEATAEAERGEARSLAILVPLIKEDFAQAEQAGMAYYHAAGEKLAEARTHFANDAKGFYAWAEKAFGKKTTQIRTYMALGAPSANNSFKSLRHFESEGLKRQSQAARSRMHREWTAPVDTIADKAREEQRRLQDAEMLSRQQEREAEGRLGLRLISIGYKVLAQELHPDKVGGSRDAMTRLNRVRDRLKVNV